jgi:aldehyde dehydrogenase (NAD+)
MGDVIYGGKYNSETLFIEPTLIEVSSSEIALMQEEIFGPLLPVLVWKDDSEVHQIIQRLSNPLALYVFTESKVKADYWTKNIAFGGGCINNAGWHLTNHHLPFGGRGNSMGQYHGQFSFDTFSHKKGIMYTPSWFNPSLKFPPFKGKLKWFKRFIK